MFQEFLDKRKMTEFGSLALVDQEEGKNISLPGVKKGDMAARNWKPEVRVSCVQFSPTGKFPSHCRAVEDIEDNSKIIFLISEQKHML